MGSSSTCHHHHMGRMVNGVCLIWPVVTNIFDWQKLGNSYISKFLLIFRCEKTVEFYSLVFLKVSNLFILYRGKLLNKFSLILTKRHFNLRHTDAKIAKRGPMKKLHLSLVILSQFIQQNVQNPKSNVEVLLFLTN